MHMTQLISYPMALAFALVKNEPASFLLALCKDSIDVNLGSECLIKPNLHEIMDFQTNIGLVPFSITLLETR